MNEIASIPVTEHYAHNIKNVGQTETIKDTIVESFVYSLNTVN